VCWLNTWRLTRKTLAARLNGRPSTLTWYRRLRRLRSKAPRDREIHYTTDAGSLTLTDAAGKPIEIEGRRFSRPLAPDDDEVAAAEQLAREARLGA
jgi:hypothetical protein